MMVQKNWERNNVQLQRHLYMTYLNVSVVKESLHLSEINED
jgi:hypothetical protein